MVFIWDIQLIKSQNTVCVRRPASKDPSYPEKKKLLWWLVVWKVNFDFVRLRVSIMRKLGFDSNHSKLIKAGIEKVTDAVSGLDSRTGPGPPTCCLRLRPRPSLTSVSQSRLIYPVSDLRHLSVSRGQGRVVTGHHPHVI